MSSTGTRKKGRMGPGVPPEAAAADVGMTRNSGAPAGAAAAGLPAAPLAAPAAADEDVEMSGRSAAAPAAAAPAAPAAAAPIAAAGMKRRAPSADPVAAKAEIDDIKKKNQKLNEFMNEVNNLLIEWGFSSETFKNLHMYAQSIHESCLFVRFGDLWHDFKRKGIEGPPSLPPLPVQLSVQEFFYLQYLQYPDIAGRLYGIISTFDNQEKANESFKKNLFTNWPTPIIYSKPPKSEEKFEGNRYNILLQELRKQTVNGFYIDSLNGSPLKYMDTGQLRVMYYIQSTCTSCDAASVYSAETAESDFALTIRGSKDKFSMPQFIPGYDYIQSLHDDGTPSMEVLEGKSTLLTCSTSGPSKGFAVDPVCAAIGLPPPRGAEKIDIITITPQINNNKIAALFALCKTCTDLPQAVECLTQWYTSDTKSALWTVDTQFLIAAAAYGVPILIHSRVNGCELYIMKQEPLSIVKIDKIYKQYLSLKSMQDSLVFLFNNAKTQYFTNLSFWNLDHPIINSIKEYLVIKIAEKISDFIAKLNLDINRISGELSRIPHGTTDDDRNSYLINLKEGESYLMNNYQYFETGYDDPNKFILLFTKKFIDDEITTLSEKLLSIKAYYYGKSSKGINPVVPVADKTPRFDALFKECADFINEINNASAGAADAARRPAVSLTVADLNNFFTEPTLSVGENIRLIFELLCYLNAHNIIYIGLFSSTLGSLINTIPIKERGDSEYVDPIIKNIYSTIRFTFPRQALNSTNMISYILSQATAFVDLECLLSSSITKETESKKVTRKKVTKKGGGVIHMGGGDTVVPEEINYFIPNQESLIRIFQKFQADKLIAEPSNISIEEIAQYILKLLKQNEEPDTFQLSNIFNLIDVISGYNEGLIPYEDILALVGYLIYDCDFTDIIIRNNNGIIKNKLAASVLYNELQESVASGQTTLQYLPPQIRVRAVGGNRRTRSRHHRSKTHKKLKHASHRRRTYRRRK